MRIFRVLSAVFLVLSLAVGASLILWDMAHGFEPMQIHQRGVAVALMLIGAAYAVAHAAGPMRMGPRVRAVSLGFAFVLWGAEQFLPPGRVGIAVDCLLVGVFVADFSISVVNRLRDDRPNGAPALQRSHTAD